MPRLATASWITWRTWICVPSGHVIEAISLCASVADSDPSVAKRIFMLQAAYVWIGRTPARDRRSACTAFPRAPRTIPLPATDVRVDEPRRGVNTGCGNGSGPYRRMSVLLLRCEWTAPTKCKEDHHDTCPVQAPS